MRKHTIQDTINQSKRTTCSVCGNKLTKDEILSATGGCDECRNNSLKNAINSIIKNQNKLKIEGGD